MRVVLARECDAGARRLVAGWGSQAVLFTPADLSSRPMAFHLDGAGPRAYLPAYPESSSVLVRIGGVLPADLPHLHPDDATYAAAELDAFLRAWLTVWPGPVLNRPSTTSLNGPGWRPEQWTAAAARAGLRTRAAHRTTTPAPESAGREAGNWVVVVGRESFGPGREEVGEQVCQLAQSAGCSLLGVLLDGDVVVEASAWPVLTGEVADAVGRLMDDAG